MTDLNPKVEYFVRKKCPPQWSLSAKKVKFYDLTFVVNGSAVYYSRNGTNMLEAGQVILIEQGSPRYAETKGMECVAFNFQLEGECPWKAGILSWNGDEQLLYYFSEFERSWFGLDENKEVYCKGIFLLILHRLMELSRPAQVNPYVDEIRKYLGSHFCDKITVRDVAEHMGLHPAYCGALFRKETGRTILQTVNLLRINRAIELLKYGGTRITDAAAECGFSDIFYFSRVFKAVTGRSPENFLRENGM